MILFCQIIRKCHGYTIYTTCHISYIVTESELTELVPEFTIASMFSFRWEILDRVHFMLSPDRSPWVHLGLLIQMNYFLLFVQLIRLTIVLRFRRQWMTGKSRSRRIHLHSFQPRTACSYPSTMMTSLDFTYSELSLEHSEATNSEKLSVVMFILGQNGSCQLGLLFEVCKVFDIDVSSWSPSLYSRRTCASWFVQDRSGVLWGLYVEVVR